MVGISAGVVVTVMALRVGGRWVVEGGGSVVKG